MSRAVEVVVPLLGEGTFGGILRGAFLQLHLVMLYIQGHLPSQVDLFRVYK